MSYYNFNKINNKSYIVEKFNTASDVPTNSMITWMETSQYNNKNGLKIQTWIPSSPIKKYSFVNSSGSKSEYPIVRDNILNGQAVLEFSVQSCMEMSNNIDLKYDNFTLVFLSRQLDKNNQRFVIGNGNKLYGYWGGGKDRLYSENWIRIDGTPVSDNSWDIYVIRRQKDPNTGAIINNMRNLGANLMCGENGAGLDGIFLNMGGCCGSETSDAQIGEFILYNTYLTDSDVIKIEGYLAQKWGLKEEMDSSSLFHVPKASSPANAIAPIDPDTLISSEEEFTETFINSENRIKEFPVNNMLLWLDTSSIKKPKNGKKIDKLESKTLDKSYWFECKEAGNGGIIRADENGLNKLPILEFKKTSSMGINKPLKEKEYSIIFVTRQINDSNKRFIVGKGNKFYGYYDGYKEKLYIEDWIVNEPTKSNNEWDIYTITRNKKGLNSFTRNGNKIAIDVPGGEGLNGIFINQGDEICCPDEVSDGQFAEMFIYNICLNSEQISIVENYLIKKWALQKILHDKHLLYKPPPPNAILPDGFDNFPINHILIWTDASILKDYIGKTISQIPSLTKNKEYYFENKKNSGPTVLDKGLNNLPVLDFTSEQNCQLNKNINAIDFTLIFLSRQKNTKNERFIIGSNDKLFGYSKNQKNRLCIEGCINNNDSISKPSDNIWDLYVIKRNTLGQSSLYRNGTRLIENSDGAKHFENLFINDGPGNCCSNESSDAQLAELLFWNKELHLDDIITVETYLMKKWGITEIDEFHPLFLLPTLSGNKNVNISFIENNDDYDSNIKSEIESFENRSNSKYFKSRKTKSDMIINKPIEEEENKMIRFRNTQEQPIKYMINNNFPSIGIKIWNDAAIFKDQNKDGIEINKWPSSTIDKAIYFIGEPESSPIVIANGLNGLPVLDFSNTDFMKLSSSITYEEFTVAFLARQMGKSNGRFIIGSGNKSLGYYDGFKNKLFLEDWVVNENTPSNDEWDIYIIRRSKDKLYSIFRNGNRINKDIVNSKCTGLDELFINKGDKGCCPTEVSDAQLAEIFVWNRSLYGKEIIEVEKYLASKWKIRDLLDQSHPFYKPKRLDSKVTTIKILQSSQKSTNLSISQIIIKDNKGINIAPSSKISASPSLFPSDIKNIIDGKEGNKSWQSGYTSKTTEKTVNISLELKDNIDIRSIEIYNRNNSFIDLASYQICLYDKNDKLLVKYQLKGIAYQTFYFNFFDKTKIRHNIIDSQKPIQVIAPSKNHAEKIAKKMKSSMSMNSTKKKNSNTSTKKNRPSMSMNSTNKKNSNTSTKKNRSSMSMNSTKKKNSNTSTRKSSSTTMKPYTSVKKSRSSSSMNKKSSSKSMKKKNI